MPQKLQVPLSNKTYDRTRKSRRSLGKLKGFMDLPMDVVFEVSFTYHSLQKMWTHPMLQAHSSQTAMYLTPKDLLQLSRLSKQFRSMFASRSSLFVWQTVFRNINLKCFEDLNEIQFASLLYDKCCMVTSPLYIPYQLYLYGSLQACGRITKRCPAFRVLRLRLCPCCRIAK